MIFEVTQCSTDKCPFKIMTGPLLYCRITNQRLTSTVWPLPENCPLKKEEIVIRKGDK